MAGASAMTYGDSSSAGVREGDVLNGKYRIERVLGVGGMGIVVAAHHLQLDERVAIKFLRPDMLGNAEIASRFAREARNAVKIKSEHVARVIDVDTLATGAPYMVMEFLEGGDLAGWLRERGALSIDLAVDFVIQACVAVAEAHALKIVHRDLKPANLFCVRTADGRLTIKVLDFGISKANGPKLSGPDTATKTTTVMGSPFYMSPEQMQSPNVDAASDIWALGVIVYELLARRVPFPGDTITEVAVKVATQAPPSLRSLRPEVPAGLEAIIYRCLEKQPRLRYRNVAELAIALAEFAPRRARPLVERIMSTIQAAGLSTSALDLPPLPAPPTSPGTILAPGTIAPFGRTAIAAGGGSRAIAALAGATGLIGVIGVGFWAKGHVSQLFASSRLGAQAVAIAEAGSDLGNAIHGTPTIGGPATARAQLPTLDEGVTTGAAAHDGAAATASTAMVGAAMVGAASATVIADRAGGAMATADGGVTPGVGLAGRNADDAGAREESGPRGAPRRSDLGPRSNGHLPGVATARAVPQPAGPMTDPGSVR